MKKLNTLVLFLLAVVSLTAQNMRSGQEINIHERVHENIYIAAGDINVNQPVDGDLVAVGGEICVKDSLLDDVLIGGGSLLVDGYCGDDLRTIAGEVTIAKDIKGDLLVTAGELILKKGTVIHGSIIAAGGELEIYGTVKGNVIVRGGEVELAGEVLGTLDVRAGELYCNGTVQGRSTLAGIDLALGRQARFMSDVSYWAKNDGEIDFAGHLENGAKAHYDENLRYELAEIDWEHSFKKGFYYWTGFRLISGLFLTFLSMALLGGYFKRHAGTTIRSPRSVILNGLLLVFGLPLLSAFAFATVVGIPVGIISTALFVIALVIANALAAVVGTFELQHFYHKSWSKGQLFLLSGLLFVGMRLLGTVPVFGAIVSFVLGAMALGHIVQIWRDTSKNGPEGPEHTEIV